MTGARIGLIGMLMFGLVGIQAHAQQPPQFKANVKMNGADGTTATGTMYFGGAKMRSELTSDGQDIIVLADPSAKTQYVLMPSEKVYMQMPIGQGPVSIPVTGPSDPTNPCSGGSGNTDCVKGEKETVDGYDVARWDYTSAEGVRTRAWVSTKLRFPIKSQDDNGSSMEFSNIAEGPQPSSLFSIPAGYTKMDVGMMGGMAAGGGRGRGRGRSNANDPVASMMANMPPEAQAAMAAAMRGQPPKGTIGPTGSAWEKGNGWIVSMTITATEAEGPTSTKDAGSTRTSRKSYSIKWTGSAPLNFVSPAAGVPGTPGPIWTLLAGQQDIGMAAANKVPITLSVTVEAKRDDSWTSDCQFSGIGYLDPGTRHETTNGTSEESTPITTIGGVVAAQGNLTLSADLKTYDLVFGVGPGKGKEETKEHTELVGCKDKQVHKEDKSSTRGASYATSVDLKGLPLPATVSAISGSKKMAVRIDGRELNANVAWTITPIR